MTEDTNPGAAPLQQPSNMMPYRDLVAEVDALRARVRKLEGREYTYQQVEAEDFRLREQIGAAQAEIAHLTTENRELRMQALSDEGQAREIRRAALEEAAKYHDEAAAKAKRRLEREQGRPNQEPFTVALGDRAASFPGNHRDELVAALKEEIVGHEWDAAAIRALIQPEEKR